MSRPNVVGRFAPTPSGRMHLGNVFAALIAWASVRSQDGEMVLRMEDLDTQRTSADFAAVLRDDLNWLGLDYDRETPADLPLLLHPQPAAQRQCPPSVRRHLRLHRHLPGSDGGRPGEI